MRTTAPSMIASVLLLTVANGWAVDPGGDLDAIIKHRAERRIETPSNRPDMARVPVPARLFHMRATDHVRCVRAVDDINGDSLPEVIATIDQSQSDNIFCLDGASTDDATVLWSLLPMSGVSNGSPYGDESVVPATDSDGNGFPNLLVGTAWGGRSAHDIDALAGTVLWTLDTYNEPDSGWVYSLTEIYGLDRDLVPNAAFGTGSDNNSVYLVDGTSAGPATVLWRYAAGDTVYSVRNLGDVSGDLADDVLAAVGDDIDRLVCLDGATTDPAGHVLWTYDPEASVYSCGVLPDITDDGNDEALVALWTGAAGSNVRCVDGETGHFIWASTSVDEPVMMVEPIKDVTGDGLSDVIVSSWENAVIVLDGSNGELAWKTTVGLTNGGDVWTARAIDDLNGDGFQDVIAGSFDTYAYAMNGRDGSVLWAFPTGYRVYSIYPVGDLTGDGRSEVVVGNQNLTGGNNIVVHVLDAGLPSVFNDGFESGGTEGWSATMN